MGRRRCTKEAVPLYPGITLRAGEIIMWEPESWRRRTKKKRDISRFTAGVDNSVERSTNISQNNQKGLV